MSAKVLIEAAVGRHARNPFWMKGILQGCRLEVENSSTFPIFGHAEVPTGTLLTFWGEGGDGGDSFGDFWIIQANAGASPISLVSSQFFVRGRFEVLAHAKHAVGQMDEPSTRLRKWWLEWAPSHGGQTPRMARWLNEEIRTDRQLPGDYPGDEEAIAFSAIDGWDVG